MMSPLVFLLISISSVFLGGMAILRKQYQIINGISMTATIFFTFFISVIGGVTGYILNGGIQPAPADMLFAFSYAVISTVTASICIYATAFGSVSVLVLWALLGSLVLPTAFGIITQPAENKFTAYKTVGFLMALSCMLIDFAADKNKEKSNLKYKLLCMVVFFTNGSALIIFNLKNRFCENISDMGFITEYMFFSVLITALCMIFIRIKQKNIISDIRSLLNIKSITVMIMYTVLFFASEMLSLKCAGLVPLIVQAPVSFAIPIITTALIDYMAYNVKLNKINIIQMILAGLCCVSFMTEGI